MFINEILTYLHKRALLCDELLDNDEAIRLCHRIETQLHKIDDLNFKSQFYLNFSKIFLNGGKIVEAEYLLNKFDFLFSGKKLLSEIIDFRLYLMSKILFLKGDFAVCNEYIDSVINSVSSHSKRSELFALKGYIETENSNGISTFSNLSIALGEAEKSNDKELVGRCYLKLSRALNQSYNALGASLIREAGRIARSINNDELYYSSLIHRANIYIFMGLKHNRNEFVTEAKDIINSISEDKLKYIGLKELFWTVKGWMLGDIQLLEKSLQFNINAGSWERVCSILIALYHISLEKGEKDKAKVYARKGCDAAIKCGNREIYTFFKNNKINKSYS